MMRRSFNRYTAGATRKQLDYLTALAKRVAPDDEPVKTLLAYGASRNEYTGGYKAPTMAEASYLIQRLTGVLATRGENGLDPGELAADRWAESQVGL